MEVIDNTIRLNSEPHGEDKSDNNLIKANKKGRGKPSSSKVNKYNEVSILECERYWKSYSQETSF